MKPSRPVFRAFLLALLLLGGLLHLEAQQITGVWKGRIDRRRVELKIVQKGDSLTGTSYYYDAPGSYRRYSIKGYFDPETNSAVWWDDQLITEKKGLALLGGGKGPQLSVADFNCPGGGEMFLDGKGGPKEEGEEPEGAVALQKTGRPQFTDEWDFVIDNFTVGANHPDIIDSVSLIAGRPVTQPPVARVEPELPPRRPGMVSIPPPPAERPKPQPEVVIATPPAPTIQDKFTARSRKFVREVPVSGDTLELRFYDNAQVDGDSISLFLDGRLLQEHIRLTEKAWVLKLPVSQLKETSELIMVAENLGAIPPNTSHMVALAGGQRYEARLASTENSSAMIRLRRVSSE